MWLVLGDPADRAALWAHKGLRERGLEPLELLSPQALLGSTRSAHRVGRHGAGFEIVLPDGRLLDSREVSGVLNRVAAAPFGLLPFDTHGDALYAQEELSALLLSLLTCLAPVAVNRPCATGLCGAWRSTAEWTVLAARAGLPVPPARISSSPGPEPDRAAVPDSDGVLVLGDRVFGAPSLAASLSAEDEEACVRLARLAGTDLLGLDLHLDDEQRPVFGGASPLPDLRSGGEPFLDHLLDHLTALPALRALPEAAR
ncbi:hypothetical protein [Kitasatospora sp. NPDC096140]|uniref:hypothetical protein n=1 Tax=Kitasatospora sp. NPDC096140 TaxID=3155425 RepID=UPI0033230D30